MSTILIDVTRLIYRRLTGTHPTGIDRVGIEYIRRYRKGARAVLCLGPFSAMLSAHDSKRVFADLLAQGEGGRALAALMIAKAVGWRWLRAPRGGGVLFNTSHAGLENGAYAWALRQAGVRVVTMVHDLIPISHPEYFPAGATETHRARMRTAASVSSAVVANSRATLEAFEQCCRDQGQRTPPMAWAPLAPGLTDLGQPVAPPRPPVPGSYFVMLGTIEPRKNHWMVLHLWRRLCESMGKAVPKLVVVGKRGWECENVVDLLERCHMLEGAVFEVGRCSDEELWPYLHHAQALLFPSFIEGFGMPVVEALSLGVPVIASDIGVLREFAGGTADFVDPLDGLGWEALVRDFARPDSVRRAAQLERIARYQAPTWAAHFDTVDALLARVAAPT